MASVSTQIAQDLEMIVVDGGSSDGTIAYLEGLQYSRLKWRSERDRGIYDALNKGLRMAGGDFVIFLNAGDAFSSADVLRRMSTVLRPGDDVVYGDARLVPAREGAPVRLQECDHATLHQRNNLCHQAAFIRRELHLLEPYDVRFKVAGDHDMWLRLLSNQRARFRKVNLCVCEYRLGGVSTQVRSRPTAIREQLLLRWLNLPESRTPCSFLVAVAKLWAESARIFGRRVLGDSGFEKLKALLGRREAR